MTVDTILSKIVFKKMSGETVRNSQILVLLMEAGRHDIIREWVENGLPTMADPPDKLIEVIKKYSTH